MRVLLLDDDPALPGGLREGLGGDAARHEIHVAATVSEGLRRLRGGETGGPCAVVLVGWEHLPGQPARALAEIRAAAEGAPVVALLPPSGGPDRDAALEAGADEALAKLPRAYPIIGRLVAEMAERRALARQQLRLSAARVDAELLLAALMVLDEAGLAVLDASGVVTVANGELARMAGRALGELLGRPVWPLLDDDSAATLRERLSGGDGAGGVRTLDLVMVDREGARLPLTARLATAKLSQHAGCHVLRLRPHLGARPSFLSFEDEADAAEDTPTRLRELLQRPEPPVLARLRLADPARIVGRSSPAAAELSAALSRTAGELLPGLLGGEDLLIPQGDGEFLVVVADASDLAAVRRLGRVAAALEGGLAASPGLAHSLLAVGGARAAEEMGALAAVEVVARPLDLTPEDADGRDMAAYLARRLRADEAVFGADTLRGLNRLQMEAACELCMVQDRHGAPSALVLPRLDERSAARQAGLLAEAGNRPELLLEIDLLGLELAAEAAAREVDRDSALAIVDLHFSVIAQRRSADRLLARCRTLPADLARGLVVNLVGVPPGTYAPKLARVTAPLHDLFRLRGLTVDDPRADLVDLEAARIGLVLVRYPDLAPLLGERHDLAQAFVRRANRGGARLLVRGVPRGEAADLRDRLGIDLTSSA
jgi:PAS domain-containing protein